MLLLHDPALKAIVAAVRTTAVPIDLLSIVGASKIQDLRSLLIIYHDLIMRCNLDYIHVYPGNYWETLKGGPHTKLADGHREYYWAKMPDGGYPRPTLAMRKLLATFARDSSNFKRLD